MFYVNQKVRMIITRYEQGKKAKCLCRATLSQYTVSRYKVQSRYKGANDHDIGSSGLVITLLHSSSRHLDHLRDHNQARIQEKTWPVY